MFIKLGVMLILMGDNYCSLNIVWFFNCSEIFLECCRNIRERMGLEKIPEMFSTVWKCWKIAVILLKHFKQPGI